MSSPSRSGSDKREPAAPSAVRRQDRVLQPTRVVAAVIIPFLLLAFCVLYPRPSDTGRLFAWHIAPPMSAMMLGSVYLGGAYFFWRVVRGRHWHEVAGGFPPVATFAALMGIATILHWDRFLHDHVAFWLWVTLYFTTPFLVLAVFLRNQREYDRGTGTELMLPNSAAVLIFLGGVASIITCAVLFLFPQRAISVWPWQLTPLTARSTGAIFSLGLAGLGALRERRWSAARILVQVAGFMLALILVAVVRARSEFDTDRALTWLFVVGFVVAVLCLIGLYVRMEGAGRWRSL